MGGDPDGTIVPMGFLATGKPRRGHGGDRGADQTPQHRRGEGDAGGCGLSRRAPGAAAHHRPAVLQLGVAGGGGCSCRASASRSTIRRWTGARCCSAAPAGSRWTRAGGRCSSASRRCRSIAIRCWARCCAATARMRGSAGPTIPRIEAAYNAWLDSDDTAEQTRLEREIQLAAFDSGAVHSARALHAARGVEQGHQRSAEGTGPGVLECQQELSGGSVFVKSSFSRSARIMISPSCRGCYTSAH